jgi:hypothetical protein
MTLEKVCQLEKETCQLENEDCQLENEGASQLEKEVCQQPLELVLSFSN